MNDRASADLTGGRPPDPGGPASADEPAWISRFTGATAAPTDPQAPPWRRWARTAPATPDHPTIWGHAPRHD